MDARRRSTASPASGSKRPRSPDNVGDVWCLQGKRSAAGSRRAACRYAGAAYVPPKLVEFTAGGVVQPGSADEADERPQVRRVAREWETMPGEGGLKREHREHRWRRAPLTGEEDPDFLKAIQESLKDDAERKSGGGRGGAPSPCGPQWRRRRTCTSSTSPTRSRNPFRIAHFVCIYVDPYV
ncbi:hypothetical protein QYE76_007842 [Lolium multiflorum]|uniref:Uncharacterized protein n=1 Tax=Lolium multiflorum TaxID=4521 RepID=A0AAD8QE00_LOLMU|nr:hypothetical protein QYE76_007842 [Lolium multiflorum]